MVEKCFKIVEMSGDNYKTLFHGVNGSRMIPLNRWIKAEKKEVSDGSSSTTYISGWHVLKTEQECKDYLKLFKNKDNKRIIPCLAKRLRPKTHSRSPVFLADEIKVEL